MVQRFHIQTVEIPSLLSNIQEILNQDSLILFKFIVQCEYQSLHFIRSTITTAIRKIIHITCVIVFPSCENFGIIGFWTKELNVNSLQSTQEQWHIRYIIIPSFCRKRRALFQPQARNCKFLSNKMIHNILFVTVKSSLFGLYQCSWISWLTLCLNELKSQRTFNTLNNGAAL